MNIFTNKSPKKKQQKVGEGKFSSQKCLPHPLAYPLKKKDLTTITVAIFTGKIPSK